MAVAVAGTDNRRPVLSLALFGIAFGYLEAAVVVYLRQFAEPFRAAAGLPPHTLFPLLAVTPTGPLARILAIEIGREAATLLMLALAAWAAASSGRRWLCGFSLAFGAWDLSFYFWLSALIGFPSSLSDWDVLFLIPVPWAAPVLAPIIVAASLAVGGAMGLLRTPPRVPALSRLLLILGAVVLLVSFMWDWRYWMAGGLPRSFPWVIFGCGEAAGIAGFLTALRARTTR